VNREAALADPACINATSSGEATIGSVVSG